MATQVLRPNGTISGASSFTLTGGGATAHATLNDNSDTTYLANATSGNATLIQDFGTYTLAANEIVRRVRVRVRTLTPTTSGKVNVNIGTRQSGQNKYSAALAIRGLYATITTLAGGWLTTSPFGGRWSQDDINDIRVLITDYKTGADKANFYEVYVDVDTSAEPTTTVSSPTGTITTTSTPEVAFTYTDPDATDEQAYYEVKMFNAAQYGAAGFEATISDAAYDSGAVDSIDQTHTITSYIPNATYRAYARVAKRISGTEFWSDWAYSAFVLNVTRPTAPTVTATWTEATGVATVSVTGVYSSSFEYQYFEVMSSIDGGVTWDQVRNAYPAYPGVGVALAVSDYEITRGVTAQYRARSVGVVGTYVADSAWSSVASVAITSDGKFWIKAITDPTINYGAANVLNKLGITVEENLGVYRPIGRTLPIIVSGTIGGQDGQLEIVTTTDAQWNAVYALSVHQYTLLLQEPTNVQKYVRFVSREWEEMQVGATKQRIIRIGYVEVDAEE